jgi:hypothetical protein
VFAARSKAEAGRLLYDRLPAHEQARTSRAALARYCGQLFWCPRHERLWFRVAVSPRPRMLYPELMPPELWAGVEEAVADDLDYRALIRRSMAPEEVPAALFRARVAAAQQGTTNQLHQTGHAVDGARTLAHPPA